jgi:hypothetical protein
MGKVEGHLENAGLFAVSTFYETPCDNRFAGIANS